MFLPLPPPTSFNWLCLVPVLARAFLLLQHHRSTSLMACLIFCSYKSTSNSWLSVTIASVTERLRRCLGFDTRDGRNIWPTFIYIVNLGVFIVRMDVCFVIINNFYMCNSSITFVYVFIIYYVINIVSYLVNLHFTQIFVLMYQYSDYLLHALVFIRNFSLHLSVRLKWLSVTTFLSVSFWIWPAYF